MLLIYTAATTVKILTETTFEYTLQVDGNNEAFGIYQWVIQGISRNWNREDGWVAQHSEVTHNGNLVGYYEFDADSDAFWIDIAGISKSFDEKEELINFMKHIEPFIVKSKNDYVYIL